MQTKTREDLNLEKVTLLPPWPQSVAAMTFSGRLVERRCNVIGIRATSMFRICS